MLTWLNFLHLYQPPTQTKETIDTVVLESYALIPKLLRKYPKLCLTINFSGSLLELLEMFGYGKLLEEYRALAEAGRIELTGSAMYHPILALLPEEEIRRQISLHAEISQRIFGSAYHPKGFFIPEMAYSEKVTDVVLSMGYTWIILDEMHFPKGAPNNMMRYIIEDNGLSVLFRNRTISKSFPPEYIEKNRLELVGQIIITAHDGELYGHWHKDDRGYYEKAFADSGIEMSTVSKYLEKEMVFPCSEQARLLRPDSIQEIQNTTGMPVRYKKDSDGKEFFEESVTLREASWESSEEELQKGEPFILWNARNNPIHKKLWTFALWVIEMVNACPKDKNFSVAQTQKDRGLASCAWWWATGAKLSAFSPICWNPTEIEKGARELLSAVRSLDVLPLETRLQAEDQYRELSKLVWETHWKNRKFDVIP